MANKITLPSLPSHNIKVWSLAEKAKVKDLFFEGYSDDEIAAELGRTAKAVGIQRHYMQLHKAQQPHKEFRIHDAMADYYPRWYKLYLREQWEKKQSMSTM
jgi:hypothetical protein